GLRTSNVLDVMVSHSSFVVNAGNGLTFLTNNIAAVVLTHVIADGNGQPDAHGVRNGAGVSVSHADSFADADGEYSGNADGGINLTDIWHDVTLTRTTADDNDADGDGVGDGLTATHLLSTVAIGGALTATGVTFSDTDAGGTVVSQSYGMFVDGVVGAVTLR